MKKVDWSSILIKGTEWFARLAVLNLVWLLFSLPLLTVIPATQTVFIILKMWNDGERLNQSVFYLFKTTFVSCFKESYRLGLPFLVIGSILVLNLTFFFTANIESTWFFILKIATFLLTVLYIYLLFYSFALSTFRKEKVKNIIEIAFIIMLSQPGYTLMIGLSIMLSTIVFDFFPALLFFFSISMIGFLFLKATEKGYKKLMQKVQMK